MSVTAAKGFVAGAVHCGVRKQDTLDLAIVHSTVPATGAGMFTVNRVQAAPVTVCKEHLELSQPQAVVANSGVANAATGAQGLADARAMAEAAAAKLGIAPEEVLVLSTGVIGAPLPVDEVVAGIDAFALGDDGDAAARSCTRSSASPSVAWRRARG
jgi:glutamate N-acetyltransferase/amino-acid N-acetyltransferase